MQRRREIHKGRACDQAEQAPSVCWLRGLHQLPGQVLLCSAGRKSLALAGAGPQGAVGARAWNMVCGHHFVLLTSAALESTSISNELEWLQRSPKDACLTVFSKGEGEHSLA